MAQDTFTLQWHVISCQHLEPLGLKGNDGLIERAALKALCAFCVDDVHRNTWRTPFHTPVLIVLICIDYYILIFWGPKASRISHNVLQSHWMCHWATCPAPKVSQRLCTNVMARRLPTARPKDSGSCDGGLMAGIDDVHGALIYIHYDYDTPCMCFFYKYV